METVYAKCISSLTEGSGTIDTAERVVVATAAEASMPV
jgi:hypothetical protein